MSYTHVIIKMGADKKGKNAYHVEADLEEVFVVENIIKPYVEGVKIFVDGSGLNANDIEKISVYRSDKTGSQLLDEAAARSEANFARAAANNVFVGYGGTTLLQAVQGVGTEEITRTLFNQAQGQ